MFSSRIPLKPLFIICRALSTMLGSGISIKKSFELAATKSSHPRARQSLRNVVLAIRKGEDVTSAMRAQGTSFPPLMIEMISVAEDTGHLPEVLRSLSEHYENNYRLKKKFISEITWPIVQLILAVLIIAALIYLLGWIAESRGGEAIDILGLGLTGSAGAFTWLFITFGGAFAAFLAYKIIRASLIGQQFLDPILLHIPVLGKCLRSFAIARFSWCFSLTQQTGMLITESLKSSFRATSNGAFIKKTGLVCSMVQQGEMLTEALDEPKLFPAEYIEMIRVGETSGTVPEMLDRLSPEFEDEARRSLELLVKGMGWLVWMIVAGFVIFVIFRIASWYGGILNDALQGV